MNEKSTRLMYKRLILSLLGIFAFVSWGLASEFVADFSNTTKGKLFGNMVFKGKIFVKGKNQREEITIGSKSRVSIFRADKRITWILDPARRTYREMISQQAKWSSIADPKNLPAIKEAGTLKLVEKETVNGYDCDKYSYVYNNKDLGIEYHWVSKKLNFPVKMIQKSKNSDVIVEFKNITEKKLSDSLFELPKGYTKLNKPAKKRNN